MIILGISPLDKDATVTLVIDGEVKFAVAEERLSRQKFHSGFPRRAIQSVCEMAGIEPQEIDHVVYSFLDAERETSLMRRNLVADRQFNRESGHPKLSKLIADARRRVTDRSLEVHGLANAMEATPKGWLKQTAYRIASGDGGWGDYVNHRQFQQWIDFATEDHHRFQQELIFGLQEFGLDTKLERVEHHESHVANAFYVSGFDRALAVTIDAYGSGLSGTVSIVDEQGIRRIHSLDTPYSLGAYYETVTSALGYRPDRHAGKIVGLAAYGDPAILSPVLEGLFVWDNGGFRMRRSSDVYLSRRLAAEFPKIDVAAAYQHVLENVVQKYVAHFVNETGIDTVVLSGGVTANVKLNQRVFEIPEVHHVYVHPGMGDGGCGTGAALLKAVEAGYKPARLDDVYLGPEYSDEKIEQVLIAEGLDYSRADDIELETARLIADNQVVARFHGRMEYGPRALGNRSILYHPADPKVNHWLNARLGRTEFMPFAPATLYEDRDRCYKNVAGAEYTAQFMTITFDCTPWMIESCPAAVHVDGTARPQLVTGDSNPGFHRILTEYKRLTGLSSVINTSFNMHEEPIVCTPGDAVRAFKLGRLDVLAIGSFVVRSPEAKRTKGSIAQEAAV